MSVNPVLVTLFPIFAIILVGYLYSCRWSTDVTIPNRLNLEVFTPALIFSALSSQSFYVADYYALMLMGTVIILGSGLILILPIRLLDINPLTFLPPMMFTN